MPVSVSVSITCKHLVIICEQMLAFGLVPSVIPSGSLPGHVIAQRCASGFSPLLTTQTHRIEEMYL